MKVDIDCQAMKDAAKNINISVKNVKEERKQLISYVNSILQAWPEKKNEIYVKALRQDIAALKDVEDVMDTYYSIVDAMARVFDEALEESSKKMKKHV